MRLSMPAGGQDELQSAQVAPLPSFPQRQPGSSSDMAGMVAQSGDAKAKHKADVGAWATPPIE